MNQSERKEIISNLENLATIVYSLKNEHRQKRPIVIEFSGSPKSGKTSSINSLELFLKRNGFKVKTLQERASVCPVSDKQSPMFNIWTACSTIAGMIGILENKDSAIDVLILDRGIFDALCWFDWLEKKGKMEESQKEIIGNFLLSYEFVKSIDIVFAFTVDPKESIKREYANLLTKKPGTIMNENVLSEYRNSVLDLCNKKQNSFHNVLCIDTTDLDQDEVGKKVTEDTLNALQELLMEKIGYFRKNEELNSVLKTDVLLDFDELMKRLPDLEFDRRDNVERRMDIVQPIPIAVITNRKRDKVLVIKKNKNAVSSQSPEKDKLLVYVGGHSRREDVIKEHKDNILEIFKSTLKREIKEEIGVSLSLSKSSPVGIYTCEDRKSMQHFAVCFVIEQEESIKLNLDKEELVQAKGKSKSGTFMSLDELYNNKENLENWSKIILNHYFGMNFDIVTQMSLDFC